MAGGGACSAAAAASRTPRLQHAHLCAALHALCPREGETRTRNGVPHALLSLAEPALLPFHPHETFVSSSPVLFALFPVPPPRLLFSPPRARLRGSPISPSTQGRCPAYCPPAAPPRRGRQQRRRRPLAHRLAAPAAAPSSRLHRLAACPMGTSSHSATCVPTGPLPCRCVPYASLAPRRPPTASTEISHNLLQHSPPTLTLALGWPTQPLSSSLSMPRRCIPSAVRSDRCVRSLVPLSCPPRPQRMALVPNESTPLLLLPLHGRSPLALPNSRSQHCALSQPRRCAAASPLPRASGGPSCTQISRAQSLSPCLG